MISTFISCDREILNEPIDDGLPPPTPGNFRIYAARDGEIGLEWLSSNEPDISGFNIFRAEFDTDFEQIGFTNNQFFVDDSLDYFTEYSYKINAVDNQGRESSFTSIVSAIPENIFRPLPVTGISINARNWDDSISIALNWFGTGETDILGFEVYRDTVSNFEVDSTKLVGFSDHPFFVDKNEIEILTEYFYRIVTVDNGNLKSNPTSIISDFVLNKPEVIFPANNYNGSDFTEFKFRTSSKKANYKIFILTNENIGTKYEFNLNQPETNAEVTIFFNTVNLVVPFKEHFWRVAAFTKNEDDPNTFTDLNSFTISRN